MSDPDGIIDINKEQLAALQAELDAVKARNAVLTAKLAPAPIKVPDDVLAQRPPYAMSPEQEADWKADLAEQWRAKQARKVPPGPR